MGMCEVGLAVPVTIAKWDFENCDGTATHNNAPPPVTTGTGVASRLNLTTGCADYTSDSNKEWRSKDWKNLSGNTTLYLQFQVATANLQNIQITFKNYREHANSPTNLTVAYSTDNSTYNNLSSPSDLQTTIATWEPKSVTLPTGANNQANLYVRFMAYGANETTPKYWYIDDVEFTGEPIPAGPTVSSYSPLDNAVDVAVASNLKLTFSTTVTAQTGKNIYIHKVSDNSVVATIAASDAQVTGSGTTTITINPTANLLYNTGYYVKIDPGAFKDGSSVDYAGITDTTTWNFTTLNDTTAPTVTNYNPADDSSGVAIGSNLVLTFSENVVKGTGNIKIKIPFPDTVIQTISVADSAVSIVNNVVTINPPKSLNCNTQYYVAIDSEAFKDEAGNSYEGISAAGTWDLTTGSDHCPTVSTFSPVQEATGVPIITPTLSLTFSGNVKAGTGNIYIKKVTDNSTIATVSVSSATFNGNTMAFSPTVSLANNIQYYVEIEAGAVVTDDTNEYPYAGIYSPSTWRFTTTSDNSPPTLTTLFPADDATEVAVGSNLVLTFDENVQAGTGNVELFKSDSTPIETFDIATDVTFAGTTVILNPTNNLDYSTQYYVKVANTAVRDLVNNNYAGIADDSTWTFTTTATPDTTAPTITALSPVNNATEVAIAGTLSMTFDEAVQSDTGSILIKKATDNSTVQTLDISTATVNGAVVSLNFTGLAYSTVYYVTVDATAVEDMSGNSFVGISDSLTWRLTTRAAPPPPPPGPNAPSNLTGTSTSVTQLNLSWQDNSSDETGFRVERSTDGAIWSLIGTVTANTTQYTVSSLNCGTSYHYRIVAYNNNGNSGYSNTLTRATAACDTSTPPTPSDPGTTPPSLPPVTSIGSLFLEVAGLGKEDSQITVNPKPKALCEEEGKNLCYRYDLGTAITLTAVAAPNAYFVGWGGHSDCIATGPVKQLQLRGSRVCTAYFRLKPHRLTLDSTGDGSGQVSTVPAGADLPQADSPCEGQCYPGGSQVTLIATPASDSQLLGWEGPEDCEDGQVTLDTAKHCTARFARLPTYTLTLDSVGSGAGLFNPDPVGSSCGPNCYRYQVNTEVNLLAIPNPTVQLEGWQGEGCQNPILMTSDRKCQAIFATLPTYRLTLQTTGTGQGSVQYSPTGNSCGPNCSLHFSGTTVTLLATPAEGSRFEGWGQDCSAETVLMDGDKLCEAGFSLTDSPTEPPPDDPTDPNVQLYHSLRVTQAGSGQGTVTFNPAGESCGTDCLRYPAGTTITLVATPAPGSSLQAWSRACESGTVTLTNNEQCLVIFKRQPTLSTQRTGAGQLQLTVPSETGETPPPCKLPLCQYSYPAGTALTLTAVPDAGYRFVNWQGSCQTGTQSPSDSQALSGSTEWTLTEDQTCVAVFEPLSQLQFSQASYEWAEEAGTLTVLVKRTGSRVGAVGVQYRIEGGSAVPDQDFISSTGELSWQDGDSQDKPLYIQLLPDQDTEPTESFKLVLSDPQGLVSLGDWAAAEVKILDVPWFTSLQFASPHYTGSESSGQAAVLVTRAGSAAGAVSVNYYTENRGTDTAIPNQDYTPLQGTLQWAAGDRSHQTITIPLTQDNLKEGEETFTVTLSAAGQGAHLGPLNQATVLISESAVANETETPTSPTETEEDVEQSPPNSALSKALLEFNATYRVVDEAGSQVELTVARTQSTQGAVAVHYRTEAITATEGEDYEAVSGVLRWETGDQQPQTLIVPIYEDELSEEDETFEVTLIEVEGPAELGMYSQVEVTVLDNDPVSTVPDSTTVTPTTPDLPPVPTPTCELAQLVTCSVTGPTETLHDVEISNTGKLSQATLSGQIRNWGELEDVTLSLNTVVYGGKMGGRIRGLPLSSAANHALASLALLNNVRILPGSYVEYVIIGNGCQLSENIQFGKGVKFAQNGLIPYQAELGPMLDSFNLPGFNRLAISLADDVLQYSALGGILGAVNSLPDLYHAQLTLLQHKGMGYLYLDLDDLRFAVLPHRVRQIFGSGNVTATGSGLTVYPDGRVIFITHTGREISAFPVVQAPLALQAALESWSLPAATVDDRGRLEIRVVNGPRFVAKPSWYSRKVRNDTPMGLSLTQPVQLTFIDEEGQYRQQTLYPTLAEDLGDAWVDEEGMFSVQVGNRFYQGRLDYQVSSGARSSNNTSLEITEVGDVNADGKMDYELSFTSGKRQLMFGQ